MRFASKPSREGTSGCHSKFFPYCHWIWLGLLMCCLQAQAQPPNGLVAPIWDGETALSTDDGYAEFSWHMPPGEYAEIYRSAATALVLWV